MLRAILTLILVVFAAFPALGQEPGDLSGAWRIISLDEDNWDFSGEIVVTPTDEHGVYHGEMITQDRCCGGNFARVRQTSVITVRGEAIQVESKIVEYLVRDEPFPGPDFNPGDFQMRWESIGSLIGLSGDSRIRWRRMDDVPIV